MNLNAINYVHKKALASFTFQMATMVVGGAIKLINILQREK